MLYLLPLFFAAPDLSSVDVFLAGDRFENAFHLGEKAVIETASCLGTFCDKPYENSFVITSVTPAAAVSEGVGSDGRPFSENSIPRADWDSLQQNRVRFELRSLEQAGYRIEITSISPGSVSVELNGQPTRVETRVVVVSGVNGAGMKTAEILEVAPGLGGVAQLVRRHLDHGSLGSDTFTVVSVSR
jgi:hypothetical protein